MFFDIDNVGLVGIFWQLFVFHIEVKRSPCWRITVLLLKKKSNFRNYETIWMIEDRIPRCLDCLLSHWSYRLYNMHDSCRNNL